MKPHHFSEDDKSLIHKSKRTTIDKLSKSKQTSKENQNQRRKSSNLEDPIRTIMFLGSWTHS
uniref:Uncharacterized protein n=1 Tax=Solanum tuberosum TaxID=4113 RepID=M1AT90_SOLTU